MKKFFQGTFKGFILGLLTAALLIPGTAVVANVLSPAGQVFTGLGFVMNGVRYDVRWDEPANTVHLTSPTGGQVPGQPGQPQPPGQPTGQGATVLGFDTLGPYNASHWSFQVGLPTSYRVRGEVIFHSQNAVRYRTAVRSTQHGDFALNRNFSRLTATIALCDTSRYDSQGSIQFLNGDTPLAEFIVNVGAPQDIDVNLTGVDTLRIRKTGMVGTPDMAVYSARFYPAR